MLVDANKSRADEIEGAGLFRAIRAVLCLRNFSGILAIIATLECTSQALPQLVGTLIPPQRTLI